MRTCVYFCTLVFSFYFYYQLNSGLNNGLATKPPMGWMSWGYFMCNISCRDNTNKDQKCINENLIKTMIDYLVDGGYKDAGYEYVVIDDCWAEFNRELSNIDKNEASKPRNILVPDKRRFPSGMKYLSDYAHLRGMKLGIYADFGNRSCTRYNPGSINNMETDAITFANWDIDYVKLDGCFAEPEDMDIGYPLFGYFLNKTGRPMVYSCSWPYYQRYIGIEPDYRYIAKHCNLWRNYWDIRDDWNLIRDIINYYAFKQNSLVPHAGPGAWNDPDQIMVGAPGLTFEESKAHMAIWAILSAPLIMSNDLSSIPPRIKREILLNKRIIAIDQDPLGQQGKMVLQQDLVQIWLKAIMPLGSYALAFLYPYDDDFIKKNHPPFEQYQRRAFDNQLQNEASKYSMDDIVHKKHEFHFDPALIGLKNPKGYLFSNVYDITEQDVWTLRPGQVKVFKIPKPGVIFLTVTPL